MHIIEFKVVNYTSKKVDEIKLNFNITELKYSIRNKARVKMLV